MVKTMRKKIKIKKIDYLPARQVTFSKRRRGIFKKAEELSVLCESEVAVVIFSATGKLFDYSSSSIKDVIERYKAHTNGVEKSDEPSVELQLENENQIGLSKELEEKSNQLRQMKAEDLEELNFDELQKLEQLVDASLGRVIQTKEELRMSEIMALERKGAELVEANNQLRQTVSNYHNHMMLSGGNTGPTLMDPERLSNNIGGGGEEEGMSSESAISTTCNSALSLSPSLGDASDDVTLSLKLGGMVKMMREKIKIKKIDYLPARQVTFSKRRRGIFKKAAELSVLCESEVAVVIFSATGKLSDYSSSSIKDVIERYEARTNGVEKSDEQSLELQLDNENHTKLSTELEEKNRQLRQMKGEDLEELDLDELLKLEQLVEATLVRVMETKEELIMSDIVALEKKGTELVEANNQMVMLRERQMVMLSKGNTGPALMEPSESATSTSCNSVLSLSLEDDCSDDVILSLKLGQTVRAGRRPMCLKT
ncbi:MADS-box protein JOINTLESS-like isoform X2 [Prunus dulcis]|uniref:MADS-box protein JOINTLESS-like isoform X2 n=1 Tax=Prunus dulcis TaxID=3755 RepID=UPI001482A671|nr:MADS-box protein JOINTLESS-like isoform X2 [Prunus dulcis]